MAHVSLTPPSVRGLQDAELHACVLLCTLCTVACAGKLEWASHDLSTIFIQRKNLFSPSFLRMVLDVIRFGREAPQVWLMGDGNRPAGSYSCPSSGRAFSLAEGWGVVARKLRTAFLAGMWHPKQQGCGKESCIALDP